MILINDALKRAQRTQQQASASPPPELQFRPVEPEQPARGGPGLMLPLGVVFALFVGVVVVWQVVHKSGSTKPAGATPQTQAGGARRPPPPGHLPRPPPLRPTQRPMLQPPPRRQRPSLPRLSSKPLCTIRHVLRQ